jgi:minor extracellular serine protease Vpr
MKKRQLTCPLFCATKIFSTLLLIVLLSVFSGSSSFAINTLQDQRYVDTRLDQSMHMQVRVMVVFSRPTILEGATEKELKQLHDNFKQYLAMKKVSYSDDLSVMYAINALELTLNSTSIGELVTYPYVQKVLWMQASSIPARGIARNHIMRHREGNEIPWTGKGIRVGVIDTGIQSDHPELLGRVIGGANLALHSDDYSDVGFHGTAIAGVLGGSGLDNFQRGIAPEVELMSYVVFSHYNANSVSIIPALDMAVRDQCKIVVLSLNGMKNCDYEPEVELLLQALSNVKKAGLAVVAAAGNQGQVWRNTDSIRLPGSSPDVLTVGASNERMVQWITIQNSHNEPPGLTVTGMLGMPSLPFSSDLSSLSLIDAGFGSTGEFRQLNRNRSGGDKAFIALVHRGPADNPITFHEKMINARDAGAKAIIFVNYPGKEVIQPRVDTPSFDIDWYKHYLPSCMVDATILNDIGDNLEDCRLQFPPFNPSLPDSWSSSGPLKAPLLKPDLLAPGAYIFSIFGYGYQWISGSSISAGMTAGAIAIMMEAYPDWNVDQIFSALVHSADQMHHPLTGQPISWHLQGSGELNLFAALEAPVHISPLSFKLQYQGELLKKTIQISNNRKESISIDLLPQLSQVLPPHDIPIEIECFPEFLKLAPMEVGSIELVFHVDERKIAYPHYEGSLQVNDLRLPFVIEFPLVKKNYAPIQEFKVSEKQWDLNSLFVDKDLKISFFLTSGSLVRNERFELMQNHATIDISLIDNNRLEWGQIFNSSRCYPGYYELSFSQLFTDRKRLPPEGSYYLQIRVWGIEMNRHAITQREIIPIRITYSPAEPLDIIWKSYRKQSIHDRFGLKLLANTELELKKFILEFRFNPTQLSCQYLEIIALRGLSDCHPVLNRIGSNTHGLIYVEWSCPSDQSIIIPKGVPLMELGFDGLQKGRADIHVSKLYAVDQNDDVLTFFSSGFSFFLYDNEFLRGDLNDDGKIDAEDWKIMETAYGTNYRDPFFDIRADINGDGYVNLMDMSYLSKQFQR